jgi:hypothetical protein
MKSSIRAFRAAAVIAAAAGLLVTSTASAATVKQFKLLDHPDGGENPPPYGLRFDNLFTTIGGTGGVTLFSMSHFNDTILTVTDNGGSLKINVKGTLYGGVKSGGGVGYGAGAYALDFTYNMNVSAVGTGWKVDPNHPTNAGTLTSLGNAQVAAGTVFNFSDKDGNENHSFQFVQDDHRLGNHPSYANQGYWVGRGWFMNSQMTPGTHDFLFLGVELIPLPSPVGMATAGLFALAAVRRRR